MPRPEIEFWYEFASSYSYLSVMRIEALAEQADVQVVWRPFLLGPVFRALGWKDSPFNVYPHKGRYMWRDVARLAHKYGLPLRQPSRFPRSSVIAARVALLGEQQDWIGAFSRAVISANYAEDREIGERSVIEEILVDLGLPAEQLLAAAESVENKEALRRQTAQASALGLFGAPSFRVEDELFWGNDRLDDAIAWATRPAPLAPSGPA